MTNSDIPKPPHCNCKSARRWHDYYLARAAWHFDAADTIAKTFGEESSCVKSIRKDALRFQEGADEIANKAHPNIKSGKWKFNL